MSVPGLILNGSSVHDIIRKKKKLFSQYSISACNFNFFTDVTKEVGKNSIMQ